MTVLHYVVHLQWSCDSIAIYVALSVSYDNCNMCCIVSGVVTVLQYVSIVSGVVTVLQYVLHCQWSCDNCNMFCIVSGVVTVMQYVLHCQ